MAEFLLELFSEEIPARMQAGAAHQLEEKLRHSLTAARLEYQRLAVYVTPRRLTAVVEGLPLHQSDFTEERKGPRVNAPEAALQGFLTSTGLDKNALRVIADKKGDYYVGMVTQHGQPTASLLSKITADIIISFDWPKSMRWSSYALRWVRPLRSILAIFDGTPLNGGIDLVTCQYAHTPSASILSYGNTTYGHRVSGNTPLPVHNFATYQTALAKHSVILDAHARRTAITEALTTLAAKANVVCTPDTGLLEEVVGLVEYPTALLGSIDAKFMQLPPEVLITSMQVHQRYFPCHHQDGRLAPYFITISNQPNSDDNGPIIAGNERVLRARLSDALFFWQQDRKQRLDGFIPALQTRIFHERVGTIGDKVTRLEALSASIAQELGYAHIMTDCRAAARLCKADLATGMVGEFPELQGIMGAYYAKADGVGAEIADAIREHYAPQGEGKSVPTKPVSIVVALADKIDTLVALMHADVPYSSSKDPFALRRTMLGIIRIIAENELPLDIIALSNNHAAAQGWPLPTSLPERLPKIALGYLKEQGLANDVLTAIMPRDGTFMIANIIIHAKLLQELRDSVDGKALLQAYKRAANIYRQAKAGDISLTMQHFSEKSLIEAAEKNLWKTLQQTTKQSSYADDIRVLTILHAPMAQFFDDVLINDATYGTNRLALVAHCLHHLQRLGNLDSLEGMSA